MTILRNVDVEIVDSQLGLSTRKVINVFNTSTKEPIVQIYEHSDSSEWTVWSKDPCPFLIWRDATELAIATWEQVNSHDSHEWNVLGGK